MTMTPERMERFRRELESMAGRIRGDLSDLEELARASLGGGAGGNLSNAPMHIADLGTEQYSQELNATLFENEEYIGREVEGAIARLDRGGFGTCERCDREIPEERLEALPYTRYCTPCSAELSDGAIADMDVGRPTGGLGGFEGRHQAGRPDDRVQINDLDHPFTNAAPDRRADREDIHAVGTAGGGTAIGGLAGTNLGEGDPDDGNLEGALGSGDFDRTLDDDHEDTSSYSGPTGGAVGGALADGRVSGGRTGRGLSPGS